MLKKLFLTIVIVIMTIPLYGQTINVGELNRLLSAWPYNLSVGGTFTASGALTLTGTIDQTISNTVAAGDIGLNLQISQATSALTGTLIGVRGNARSNIATTSSTGTVQGGKFQAGNMTAGYNLATVTGVYSEVVNKVPDNTVDATVTWTNARAYEANLDLNQGESGKTNTITNAYLFYGVYNLPTAGTYTTVTNGYGALFRNEKVGGNGQMLDAGIVIDDLNMLGGIKGWDYGIDMNGIEAGFGTADFRLNYGALINNSDANTLRITEATTSFVGNVAIGDSTTGDVDAILYFKDDASETSESLSWNDGNDQFELSDDFAPTGHVLGAGTGGSTDNTLADTMLVTGQVSATTGFTDRTFTNDGTGSFTAILDLTATNDITADSLIGTTGIRTAGDISADSLVATNGVRVGGDVTADSLIATTGFRTSGHIDANGTSGSLDHEFADTVNVAGEVSATTIAVTGSITDGTYTSDGTGGFTGVASLTSTSITTTAFLQAGVAVTNTDTFLVSAANSGKVHLIGDLAQDVLIILPAAAAGLNYEFWYYGAAAETHDDTLIALNSGDFFKGNLLFADTGNAISSVYSNGSTNWELTLVNMNGGTKFKVFADATNWFITGTIVSDAAPSFSDH